jgi:hypothetical protein
VRGLVVCCGALRVTGAKRAPALLQHPANERLLEALADERAWGVEMGPVELGPHEPLVEIGHRPHPSDYQPVEPSPALVYKAFALVIVT